MGKRLNFARMGAALAVAAVAASVAALPAMADTATGKLRERNGAPGNLAGTDGYEINLVGWKKPILTKSMDLFLDSGEKLSVYCVEIKVNASADTTMVESDWAKFPNAASPFNKNRDKINWALHHGYPAKSLEELNKLPIEWGSGGLEEVEAVTATQAAVWHFSDGVDINRDDLIAVKERAEDAPDVIALYDYLTGSANVGIDEQLKGDLKVTPDNANGAPGSKIGPFKVATNGVVTGVESDLPEGFEVVTSEGRSLSAEDTEVVDGTEFHVQVPADAEPGAAELSFTADSPAVETGRLFVGENYAKNPVQSLIVADSATTPLTAKAKIAWGDTPASSAPGEATSAPAPQAGNAPELADTGASIAIPVVLGVVLVGAGAGALYYQRRRNNA
ncbi:thioester domain-containing protein [Actinokineospora pegani]|uniref:thioester domain-containing protein n=1 Tax=Actinokineospora pegani TaxID=2654637 RepID=UPI0012EA3341|nr:thioester domain-containing protein [Actinokineospora pegani]